MLWKTDMPEDMAELIDTARTLAFEAKALEEEDEDWDEDLDDGPEIIYVRGEAADIDDDEELDDE